MKATKRTIQDPTLKFLRTGFQGVSKAHANAVLLIATLLWRAGFKVNYSHTNTTVPKTKSLPLYLEAGKGKRVHFELTFELDDYLVFVDLIAVNKKRLGYG